MTVKEAKRVLGNHLEHWQRLAKEKICTKQEGVETISAFEIAIKALEQEPKTGHWIHDGSHWKNRFICSECNYKLFDEPTNHCPNCGAKMVEPQESEDKV